MTEKQIKKILNGSERFEFLAVSMNGTRAELWDKYDEESISIHGIKKMKQVEFLDKLFERCRMSGIGTGRIQARAEVRKAIGIDQEPF